MTNLEKAEAMAEKLRQERYSLLTNDCFIKSLRFKRKCRALGIPARAAACIGLAKARLFGRWLTIPVLHGWGQAEGRRIETSRPIGASGIWGIVPVNIRPVIAVRF